MKLLCEEYACALYEIAKEHSLEETILEQMKQLSELLSLNPDYVKLLDNPSVEKETRTKLAYDAFEDVEEYLRNFIMLLVEARSLNEFSQCAVIFSRLYDENHGIIRAQAISATSLDKSQCEQIRSKLEAMTGKTVILTNTVDSSVIGGIILKYGAKQIDMSVRTSLNSISEMISSTDI